MNAVTIHISEPIRTKNELIYLFRVLIGKTKYENLSDDEIKESLDFALKRLR